MLLNKLSTLTKFINVHHPLTTRVTEKPQFTNYVKKNAPISRTLHEEHTSKYDAQHIYFVLEPIQAK